MALVIKSRCIKGVNVGRTHVRCAAVPLGHVHFTPPSITPVPATENVSSLTYNSIRKTFQVVQAPYDALKTESLYLLAERDGDAERKNFDLQDFIRNLVDKKNKDTNDKIDNQKGTLGRSNDNQQK